MNNAPHANAAKVFINWYLSREGQIAFRQANNTIEDEITTSMREDLPLEVCPRSGAAARKNVNYIEISRARLDGVEAGGRFDKCRAADGRGNEVRNVRHLGKREGSRNLGL